MWLDEIKNLKLPRLTRGGHKKNSKELCLMELIAFMEREKHSDHPKCVCETMIPLGIMLNDSAPADHYRQRLLRLAPMMVGTATHEGRVTPPKFDLPEDLFIVRRMEHGRMRERCVTVAERRVEMLERFVNWVTGDNRMRGLHHEHNYSREFHWHSPYERARRLVTILGECRGKQQYEGDASVWLMGYSVLESMILAGPHTSEIKGWVAPQALKRAKQWVKEYALA
jgi:hypothetical protein